MLDGGAIEVQFESLDLDNISLGNDAHGLDISAVSGPKLSDFSLDPLANHHATDLGAAHQFGNIQ